MILNTAVFSLTSIDMVSNTNDDKSLISLTVSLLRSIISRDNSIEVYPDKSMISLTT